MRTQKQFLQLCALSVEDSTGTGRPNDISCIALDPCKCRTLDSAGFGNISFSFMNKPMKMTKTIPTRSVHFAATSHLIIYPKDKDDLTVTGNNNDSDWYSTDDKARFQQETFQQVLRLRTSLGFHSVSPPAHDFSEDDLINCTGIEPLVLLSGRMLRQLQETKMAHIDNIIAAQRHLNTVELSRMSCRTSDDAMQRAYAIANVSLRP